MLSSLSVIARGNADAAPAVPVGPFLEYSFDRSISMFWKRKSKAGPLGAQGHHAIPEGRRVYAIGDIHGRDDLFGRVIDMIRADHEARGPAELTIILLGDLVDRGPESARVVERALELKREFSDTRLLIGNHEECFLAALTGDVRRLKYFMRIGGDATIRSYWGDDEGFEMASFDEVAARLPTLVPSRHVDFLGNGEDLIEIGDFAFVHAGVRPGVPLEKQDRNDLRWIRDDFLDHMGDHGKMIVHGHTITACPDEQANRLGIDTGAFKSGTLAALGLEADARWFLFARDSDAGLDKRDPIVET